MLQVYALFTICHSRKQYSIQFVLRPLAAIIINGKLRQSRPLPYLAILWLCHVTATGNA